MNAKLRCPVASWFFDHMDRSRPLNRFFGDRLDELCEHVAIVPDHPPSILNDFGAGKNDVAIVRMEDAFWALCHGKWQIIAVNHVFAPGQWVDVRTTYANANPDFLWFALIKAPGFIGGEAYEKLLSVFADKGYRFDGSRCEVPATVSVEIPAREQSQFTLRLGPLQISWFHSKT